MLTVRVLGQVGAYLDGVRLQVPAGRTTELLARLALSCGTVVRSDALVQDLWSLPIGRNTLQSKVSQLRRALQDPDLVVGSSGGYLLGVDPDQVDAARAEQLAGSALQARTAGDPAGGLQQARAGLSCFTGDVLVGVGDWAEPHRARLGLLRVELVETVAGCRVDLGAGAELVTELESLVQAHPLREQLWVYLVTALYRAGRQGDALAAYTRVRRMLAEELGAEPGMALRSVEREVLRHGRLLAGPERPAGRPGNLPPEPNGLVGRAEDQQALHAALAEHRLVTVVGPAGVGKTRLAIQVARDTAAVSGSWLVRLDEVEEGSDLSQVVADTMHVAGGEPGLLERLAGSPTVLVLDNCEHLAGPVADLVTRLLQAVPSMTVLSTSQLPLGLEQEHVHRLEPLSQPDSVALFVHRATQQRRSFSPSDDAMAVVAQLCRTLDGLPLAIELAAARVRSLSVRDIAARLDRRFALLADPSSQRPPRRRALESAIWWSYDLLFPDDQRGLWALSCFAGGATLDALEQVLVDLDVPAPTCVDVLARLVDRSLVTVDDAGESGLRYRLLDSIRVFAADRLLESGLAHVAAAAHAGWYAAMADTCRRQVRGPGQPRCLDLARTERANVDLALSWCVTRDRGMGLQIATGLGWTWVVLGEGTAGAARLRAAIDADGPLPMQCTAWLQAGWLEASAGDVHLAQLDLDLAAQLAEKAQDTTLLADVDLHRAFLAIQQGQPTQVQVHATAALRAFRDLGTTWGTAASLLLRAYGRLMTGETRAAAGDAREGLALVQPLGDSWGIVHAQAILAGVAQAEHRLPDAADCARTRSPGIAGARLRRPGGAAPHEPRTRPAAGRRPALRRHPQGSARRGNHRRRRPPGRHREAAPGSTATSGR